MESAGTHLHVIGLQDDAAPGRPVLLQCKDEALERSRWIQVVLTLASGGEKIRFGHRLNTGFQQGKVAGTLSAASRGVKRAKWPRPGFTGCLNLCARPATNKKKQGWGEATMLAFQLIGLTFTVLFFGAMVTGQRSLDR